MLAFSNVSTTTVESPSDLISSAAVLRDFSSYDPIVTNASAAIADFAVASPIPELPPMINTLCPLIISRIANSPRLPVQRSHSQPRLCIALGECSQGSSRILPAAPFAISIWPCCALHSGNFWAIGICNRRSRTASAIYNMVFGSCFDTKATERIKG